jgi:hypothetical protein
MQNIRVVASRAQKERALVAMEQVRRVQLAQRIRQRSVKAATLAIRLVRPTRVSLTTALAQTDKVLLAMAALQTEPKNAKAVTLDTRCWRLAGARRINVIARTVKVQQARNALKTGPTNVPAAQRVSCWNPHLVRLSNVHAKTVRAHHTLLANKKETQTA